MSATTVVGVDGCRDGWVAATLCDTHVISVTTHSTATEVFDAAVASGASVVGIDMPIRLSTDGNRPGDVEARRILGPRASSLFPTPVESVLEATDYDDACRRSRAASGKALSKQAWNLVPRIREVRAALAEVDRGHVVIREVHPETSFAVMAGAPFASTKKSAAGIAARLEVLSGQMSGLVEATATLPEPAAGGPRPAIDDVLDAAAAAWTARRIATGSARTLGDGGVTV